MLYRIRTVEVCGNRQHEVREQRLDGTERPVAWFTWDRKELALAFVKQLNETATVEIVEEAA
jgi:hypothetical protein